MTTSDWITLSGAAATFIAILVAPLIAIWIGGILQKRSEANSRKLSLFATLVGLRHDPISADAVRTLNLIDVVFADDLAVREAWSKYFTVLNNAAFDDAAGYAIREDRKRELLLAMANSVKWGGKISTADLLRTYMPQAVATDHYIGVLERQVKIAEFRGVLKKHNIPDPSPEFAMQLTPAATPPAGTATPSPMPTAAAPSPQSPPADGSPKAQ